MDRKTCFVLASFILLSSSCQSELFSSQESIPPIESIETTERKEIEENTEIFIPPSAQDFHGYLTGVRDTDFYIRFTVDAKEMTPIVESSVCELPLKESGLPWEYSGMFVEGFDWWTPESATTFLWCSGSQGSAHQTIFFDTTNALHYIVYILDAWY